VANRKVLVEVCIAEAAKAGKAIIAHVGHPRQSVALELAMHAKICGATAVSSMPPFIGAVTFAMVVSFYRELAAAVAPVPVIAYHIPTITKMQMTTAELCMLLDIDGVVGFKYTDVDLYKLERTRAARPDAIIFHGMSTVQVPAMLFGACGGITGGGGNIAPKVMSDLVAAVKAGNIVEAMRLQRAFNAVQEALYGPFSSKMVATFKAILVWQGVLTTGMMVQDPHLTSAEIVDLRAALLAIPAIKETLSTLDSPLYP
jgi:N-acetylneuraminate lyase